MARRACSCCDGRLQTIASTQDGFAVIGPLGPTINQDGTVVFRADRDDGVQGIYSSHKGTVGTVAETGDIFETLAPFPSVNDSGTVAFAATLRDRGGAIITVKDGRITVIDTEGAFESFRGALIDGAGSVVRIATPRGGSLGLFAGPDPEADRILAIGDVLLGSTVAEVASNPVSINGPGQLAIRVRLTDGRQPSSPRRRRAWCCRS